MKASTRKRLETQLRKDHWFGVPRWLVVALAVAVLIGYGTFGRPTKGPAPVSDQVQTIVEGLRTTSVYEAPDSPGKVDVARTKDLIGDRPIVVVLLGENTQSTWDPFDDHGPDLCEQVAEVVATSLVILYGRKYHGDYGPDFCVGPEFSNPQNPVEPDNYDFVLIARAEIGWRYRVTEDDLFPQIEEFVFAFDEQAAEDYPGGTPRRAVVVPPPPSPDTLQTWQIILSLSGILAGTIALFVALRLVARVVTRRAAQGADLRTRTEAASARLNRLADVVLHPPPPENAADARRQADLAGEYVRVLAEFEAANTRSKLAAVDRRLAELEKEAVS
ncbi:MAG: hypothetical protein M3422_25755 [Actinomycetota bacterium]|nr:hypothetical protein [Actinomycetota bacterium]